MKLKIEMQKILAMYQYNNGLMSVLQKPVKTDKSQNVKTLNMKF
jgi:hypothetical protein